MRSVSRVRLAVCREVRDRPTAEDVALWYAKARVFDMRWKLAEVLWTRKGWSIKEAILFAHANEDGCDPALP